MKASLTLVEAKGAVAPNELTEAARQEALAAARGPEPEGAASDLIARFRANAAARATQIAVRGPDSTLTYFELDRFSDALAIRLRTLGVRRESRVGVAVPRGARELAVMLATLKAGGCYVPVDPTHPA